MYDLFCSDSVVTFFFFEPLLAHFAHFQILLSKNAAEPECNKRIVNSKFLKNPSSVF